MKKLLTVIMLFTMLCTMFSGVSVYADDTNSQAQQTIKVPAGYELIPIGRYSGAKPVSSGMIAVSIGDSSPFIPEVFPKGLWGFVDATTGHVAIEPKYLSRFEYRFSDGMALVYVKDKGFTYIDKTGQEIYQVGNNNGIGLNYDYNYVNGVACIITGKGTGLIDKTGKVVVEPGTYVLPSPTGITAHFKTNRIVIKTPITYDSKSKQNTWSTGVIDTKGNIVIPLGKYGSIGTFSDGLAIATADNFFEGESYLIDINGDKVLTLDKGPSNLYSYSCISEGILSFNYEIVTRDKNGRYLDSDGYMGLVDMTGKVIMPITNKYGSGSAQFHNGYAKLSSGPTSTDLETDTDFYKEYIIDKTGKEVLSTIARGEKFKWVSDGLAEKFNPDSPTGGWALYNLATGKNILPEGYTSYTYNSAISDDRIKVSKLVNDYSDVEYGVIDKQGKWVVPAGTYADMGGYSERKLVVQDKNGHWGYLDLSGKEIIAPQFDKATPFMEGKAVVGIYAGMGTAREGVAAVPEYNYYILRDKSYVAVDDGSVPAKPTVPTINAVPTDSKVLVNGSLTAFDAYNINGSNYFKLRDLAQAISGTEKQFAVSWDGEKNAIDLVSGKAYTVVGGELGKGDGKAKSATLCTSTIYKDGQVIKLTAYTINGSNYFKLRDVAQAFNIGVIWNGDTNTVGIDTATAYAP